MGDCVYCGKSAGFLKSYHKECKNSFETGKRQMLSLITSSLKERPPQEELMNKLRELSTPHFIEKNAFKTILVQGWESSVESAFEDGILAKEEEDVLSGLVESFSLTQNDLDTHQCYTKLVKGAIIREVLEGKIPKRIAIEGSLPFNLQKEESLIWFFQDVAYHEAKTTRSYAGDYSGVSIRIAKGLYYRTGAFRGHPVEKSQMVHADTGIFGVTNKHVYFTGTSKSFRIRHDKVVSLIPYSDGVGLQRDAATAKPQIFVTGDGWFTYNLLLNVSKL